MADRSRPIVIIGAGASGLMAAIAASRVRPRRILLLEKEARAGRKLLATGNGRCNLLNTRLSAERYHGGGAKAALSLLTRTPPAALIDAFATLGLRCREEGEGRVYPFSGQASAVLDVLRLACERQQVQLRTDARVLAIIARPGGFTLTLGDGQTVDAPRVIVAAGGKASPAHGADGDAFSLLASLGHGITPLYPAIAPLRLPADRVRGLKGVRAQVCLRLLVEGKPLQAEQGEALFTDYGISGIAAMQLAREVNTALARRAAPQLEIELMPPEDARDELSRRAALLAGAPLEQLFTGLLHKQLGLCLLREAGLSPSAAISPGATARLLPLLARWTLPVQGTQPFAQAQITAGGADIAQFDPDTLASRLVPGLYACGEALDVDGDCGGYNLMWCWASAIAAGEAAAHSLEAQ